MRNPAFMRQAMNPASIQARMQLQPTALELIQRCEAYAELGRDQLTLGRQGVAQGDDGPGQTKYINFVLFKHVYQS